MRYRMELVDAELVVRNVETDVVLGSVDTFYNTSSPAGPIFGCHVLNRDGEEIATISTMTVPSPMEIASEAIANHEAYWGYPGLKKAVKGCDPHRLEWLLGGTAADAACCLARAWLEWQAGGVSVEARSKWDDLIGQLYDIWHASRFGSFDAERGVHEPYFAGDPRRSFAAAAQHYGSLELLIRFPDADEKILGKLVACALELLGDALMRTVEEMPSGGKGAKIAA